jgi:methylase of polypeptide subunit release factors
MVSPPPPDAAARLREFLVEAGYSEQGLQKKLGIAKPPLQQFGLLDRLLDETAEPTPIHVLVRWFFLSRPVTRAAAARALPSWFLESCAGSGLLAAGDEGWTATCMLAPYEDLLIASDPYARLQSPERYDHVLSVNPAALNLVHFTVRSEVDTLLDLGAGCGIQALVASRHARRVVAADLNPRATRYVEFNARLNGIANVEALTGDRFAPVAGRRFDRIVSNPPFVLAPSARYLYRDSEMELDGFCRSLAREVPAHLEEGGIFQMICEWPEIEGQSWRERIGEWFRGLPCDVWVMKGNVQEPSGYADSRIREALPPSDAAASEQFREWMDHYRRARVRAIHGGMVTMRRRSGTNWIRLEDRAGTVHGPFGEHVLTGLANRDFLEAHPADESMLAARPRLLERALLETQARRVDSEWRPTAMRLMSADGLRQVIGLEGDVAQFLLQFDGRRTLGELIDELGRQVQVEAPRVRTECLRMARLLLERGFLAV